MSWFFNYHQQCVKFEYQDLIISSYIKAELIERPLSFFMKERCTQLVLGEFIGGEILMLIKRAQSWLSVGPFQKGEV